MYWKQIVQIVIIVDDNFLTKLQNKVWHEKRNELLFFPWMLLLLWNLKTSRGCWQDEGSGKNLKQTTHNVFPGVTFVAVQALNSVLKVWHTRLSEWHILMFSLNTTQRLLKRFVTCTSVEELGIQPKSAEMFAKIEQSEARWREFVTHGKQLILCLMPIPIQVWALVLGVGFTVSAYHCVHVLNV